MKLAVVFVLTLVVICSAGPVSKEHPEKKLNQPPKVIVSRDVPIGKQQVTVCKPHLASGLPIVVLFTKSTVVNKYLCESEHVVTVIADIGAVEDASDLLKELKESARSFGGNGNKITIIGEETSAEIVWKLLQHKLSHAYFHNAVLFNIIPGLFDIDVDLDHLPAKSVIFGVKPKMPAHIKRNEAIKGVVEFLSPGDAHLRKVLTGFYEDQVPQAVIQDVVIFRGLMGAFDRIQENGGKVYFYEGNNHMDQLFNAFVAFALAGVPGVFRKELTWPAFDHDSRSYFNLQTNKVSIGSGWRQKNHAVWTKILKNLPVPQKVQPPMVKSHQKEAQENNILKEAIRVTSEEHKVNGEYGVKAEDGPIVQTKYGAIQGSTKEYKDGRAYDEFLGVQFGAPPVGNQRFRKAEEPESWEGVRDATEFSPHCMHFIAAFYPLAGGGISGNTSEDCLYLNVWVPGNVDEDRNLAVMVWVYGGAFILGTAAMYPGELLALNGDVIVVGVNYRVSTLGWLSTEDDAARGNWGLWDIERSLGWVQDNIREFGGDPDRVTVFGQSAGGAIASHVTISPATENLFHRSIVISGGSSGFFGTAQEGSLAESTQTLARTVGCRFMNHSWDLLDCLREQEAFALDFWGVVGVVVFRNQLPNWMPVVDGDFIPKHPKEMWADGAGTGKDMITGSTAQDSAAFVLLNPFGLPYELLDRLNISLNLAGSKEILNRVLDFVLSIYDDPDAAKEAIFDQYPDLDSNDTDIRTRAAVKGTTDWLFESIPRYEASQHSQNDDNTYVYNFNYRQSFMQYPQEWIEGSHVDDVYSVFGEPFADGFRQRFLRANWSDTDRKVSEEIVNYYTNFAKTGNPNEGADVPEEWPEYADGTYIKFRDSPSINQETDEEQQAYEFWNERFMDIANPPNTQTKEEVQPMLTENVMDADVSVPSEDDIDEAVTKIKNLLEVLYMDADMLEEWDQLEEKIDKAVSDRLMRLDMFTEN